jgi:type IV secretion system protein TrbI
VRKNLQLWLPSIVSMALLGWAVVQAVRPMPTASANIGRTPVEPRAKDTGATGQALAAQNTAVVAATPPVPVLDFPPRLLHGDPPSKPIPAPPRYTPEQVAALENNIDFKTMARPSEVAGHFKSGMEVYAADLEPPRRADKPAPAPRPPLPSSPLAATSVTPAPSLPMVAQGVLIDVALTHDIKTDLPGTIEARVVAPVFDSTGKGIAVIPQGTRLLGRYDTSIQAGQEGVAARFTRMIFPNGASLDLADAAAVDAGGRTGIPGEADHNTLRTFAAAALVGLLAWGVDRAVYAEQRQLAAAQAQAGGSTLVVGSTTTPGSIAAQVVGETGRTVLQRQLARPSSIRVEKDARFRVQVQRDLIFDPRVWQHD